MTSEPRRKKGGTIDRFSAILSALFRQVIAQETDIGSDSLTCLGRHIAGNLPSVRFVDGHASLDIEK
jgi:hypothetical protein